MTEPMDYESLYSLYQSCLDSNAHLQHELERLNDELAKSAVPEGWQLVPIFPDNKMLNSVFLLPFLDLTEFSNFEEASKAMVMRTYKAMLESAPKAP